MSSTDTDNTTDTSGSSWINLGAGILAVMVALALTKLDQQVVLLSGAGLWFLGVGNLLIVLADRFKQRSQQAGRTTSAHQETQWTGLICVGGGLVMTLVAAGVLWI